MGARSHVAGFLGRYRAAFGSFDVSAIAGLFAYPCRTTSDAGEIDVTVIPTREAWVREFGRLVAAYQTIGLSSAEVRGFRVTELTPKLNPGGRRLASDRRRGSDAL